MQTFQSRSGLLWGFVKGVGLVLAFAVLFGVRLIEADDKPTPTAKEKAAHLERMRQLAHSIRVFEVKDDQRVAAKLVDRPVLAYRDDTRQQHDSTMWIFGGEGRPTAMIAVEHYPEKTRAGEWLFEVASLSAGRIVAERAPELQWQARQPGLNLTVLEGAPSPAEKPAARLAQMRELRRRFAAHEREGTDGRVELQALTAPLYRYQDAKQGIIDGAIFAFANGTNPEVLWIIEAHGVPDTAPRWKFGLVQMTGAAVYVALDEKEIWNRPDADPPAVRDSYVNGWMSAAPAASK